MMNSSESALKIDMYLRRENRSIGFHPGWLKREILFFHSERRSRPTEGREFQASGSNERAGRECHEVRYLQP